MNKINLDINNFWQVYSMIGEAFMVVTFYLKTIMLISEV